jgi:protein SCO1
MKSSLIVQLSIALVLGIILAVFAVFALAQPYTYQGSLIDPPAPAADFSLEATDGSTFHLSERRGQVVLLFFGYTHCPDVCPTTLYDYKQVIQQLKGKSDRVDFLFVTVDPERDSLDHLAEYATAFDPGILGLSGKPEVLTEMYQNYGVFVEKKDVGSAAGYLVDHTARVYVIDQSGNLRLTFPFGMQAEAMADDLLHLIDG